MKFSNLILALTLLFSVNFLTAQKATVNTNESNVHWLGKKVLGQHEGNIDIKSGYFEMDGERIVSGNIVIDMTSISNTDLEDEGYNQKLVGHLKSDDFFGVEKYPTAQFVLSQATAFKNGKANVSGQITIKGKTESISFDVDRTAHGYNAKLEIDRSKFNVKYGSNSFFDNLGDKAINDIFSLDIKLVMTHR